VDMQLDGDFYEDDESTEELLAAFDAGQPATLTPPATKQMSIVNLRGPAGDDAGQPVPTYGAGLLVSTYRPLAMTISAPTLTPV